MLLLPAHHILPILTRVSRICPGWHSWPTWWLANHFQRHVSSTHEAMPEIVEAVISMLGA